MYLIDREIRRRLDELQFESSNSSFPFKPDEQVQPCSVDLRLCHQFWKPIRGRRISLKRSKLMELSPRRYWKKVVLRDGGSIELKPGDMLLGRTCEEFSIPSDCAGKLEGRSSFARMGLAVHCAADFINPGYRGRMPLQLVNLGKHRIELVPYAPICQLMLIKLSGKPDREYGDKELFSKYMHDDGGPSYWWRDKRIRDLQQHMNERDLATGLQEEILTIIGPCEPELIERFERFVAKQSTGNISNARDVLESFASSETGSQRRDRILRFLGSFALFGLCLSALIGLLLSSTTQTVQICRIVAGSATVLSAAYGVYSFLYREEQGTYLTPPEAERRLREFDSPE